MAGDAGDPLGGRVPEDDFALAVDGDDPVGDVGQDRDAALLLERDALVELGARERGRRVAGEGRERLDLLLAPGARAAAVDREHALHRSLGADERERRRTRRSRRRASGRPAAGAGPRGRRGPRPASATGPRRRRGARSRRRASRARSGRPPPTPAAATSSSPSSSRITAASASSSVGAWRTTSSSTAAGSSSVASSEPVRASCCARRAGAPLGLEQLAPLERAAGRAGEVARELEVVVGEAPFLREEDEHERALVGARRLDRDGQQRAVAALARNLAPLLVEALVVLEPRRGEHAPVARGRRAAARTDRRARSGGTARAGPEDCAGRRAEGRRRAASARPRCAPPSASEAACASASKVSSREIGWPSTAAIR